MKIKIFKDFNDKALEQEVNNFIKTVNVITILQNALQSSSITGIVITVIYQDK